MRTCPLNARAPLSAGSGGALARVMRCLLSVVLLVMLALPPTQAAAQLPSPAAEPITPIPAPPPLSAAGQRQVALGAALFEDPRLSGNGTRSCASCHDLHSNGATAQARDLTPDGRPLERNTNTVFNAALSFRQGWIGDARTLEDQASQSLQSPDFLAGKPSEVIARLRSDPRSVQGFNAAYGHGPDWATLLAAIATFERTLLTPGSRFDRWLGGDPAALTPAELAGYQLFKSIGCVSCHQGINIGGNLFEQQRVIDPVSEADHQMFRVPSLRNVAMTPPYFHNGSAPTLERAVHRMARAQLGRDLSDQDVLSITGFLHTLTGRYQGQDVSVPK